MFKFYVGVNCLVVNYIVMFDMFEGNVMCVLGEVLGYMVLEVVMDEMVEKLGFDLIVFCIFNEFEVVFGDLFKKFFDCNLVCCLCEGVECFNWNKCNFRLVQVREGDWLIGMGVFVGYCGVLIMKLVVWVWFDGQGGVIVEIDMIDIGIGFYMIIVQMVVEIMGVLLEWVQVIFGDFCYFVFVGFGGQWGVVSFIVGVYVVCVSLCCKVGEKLGFDGDIVDFVNGCI